MGVVSGKIAKILDKDSTFDGVDATVSKETLDQLVARGYITEKTREEERDHVRRFAALLHKNSMSSQKKYMFMVSYDCNFRCAYCYEGGISKQGNAWSKKTFTKEMVDRAYEAMKEIEPDETKRSKEITLYGGEPFLKENVDIVEYIVKKGIEEGYHFNAITNGHDLDAYAHVLDTGAITHLQVTLDGDKDLHDSRRYHYQTMNSFDKIIENIGLALSKNIGISVRFNMDANNAPHVKRLKELFDDKGFSDNKSFNFYTALLRGGEGNIDPDSTLLQNKIVNDNDVMEQDNDDYKYLSRSEFNEVNNDIGLASSNQDYGLYQKLFSAIKYGNYLRVQSVFCGVQSNMFIFDPVGEMYNCWETVGIKNHVLGNYKEKINWNEELKNWQERNVGNTPKCSVCKYSLLCGGGCLAKALRYGGKKGFKAAYCDNYGDIVKHTLNKVYADWITLNESEKEKATEVAV